MLITSAVVLPEAASRGNIPALWHRRLSLTALRKVLRTAELLQLSSGIHYSQEDHSDVIGANVKEWLIGLGVGSSPRQKLAL